MKKLKQLRVKAGYTQSRLGMMVGVSRLTIARYESGMRKPSVSMLKKLAAVFDVSLDELVSEDIA